MNKEIRFFIWNDEGFEEKIGSFDKRIYRLLSIVGWFWIYIMGLLRSIK